MNILVIGGTGLIGQHITSALLEVGHRVTIGTRGQGQDNFGDKVERLVLDRQNPENLKDVLGNLTFDVVYDTQAYTSNDVKYLLDAITPSKYIQISTITCYFPNLKDGLKEEDFDPKAYPLRWLNRKDDNYGEIKRQAECAIYQQFPHVLSISVRFPFIVGTDDITRRLHFYVEKVIQNQPLFVNNPTEKLSFIQSHEAGDFMAWLADQNINGPVNASAIGTLSVGEILAYIQSKTGIAPILSETGAPAPYNNVGQFSLDLSKTSYPFSHLQGWIFDLLDHLIEEASHD